MGLFDRDRDFYLPAEWQELTASAQGKADILELYRDSTFWLKGRVPVNLVFWGSDPHWVGIGEMQYQDAFIGIYRIP